MWILSHSSALGRSIGRSRCRSIQSPCSAKGSLPSSKSSAHAFCKSCSQERLSFEHAPLHPQAMSFEHARYLRAPAVVRDVVGDDPGACWSCRYPPTQPAQRSSYPSRTPRCRPAADGLVGYAVKSAANPPYIESRFIQRREYLARRTARLRARKRAASEFVKKSSRAKGGRAASSARQAGSLPGLGFPPERRTVSPE